MRLLFDIETNGFLRHKDPSKVADRIHCLVACDVDVPRTTFAYRPGGLDAALSHLSIADALIGHNIQSYDLPILKKLTGWEPRPDVEIFDTFVLSPLIWSDLKDMDFRKIQSGRPELQGHAGKHSLQAWGVRVGEHKQDYKGGFEQFSEEMLEYCIQDVKTNLKIWELMESKLPPTEAVRLEHEFAEVLHRQEEAGVLFDVVAAGRLQGVLSAEREQLHAEIHRLTNTKLAYQRRKIDGRFREVEFECCPELDVIYTTPKKGDTKTKRFAFNPSSRDHIAKFFGVKYGWKPTEWTPGGKPQIDEKVLGGLEFPEAKVLTRALLVQKRLGQLAEGPQSLLKKVDADGRIHGRIHHNGTLTGRCAHTSPNLGQVPRVGAPWGEEFRSLFIVPGGYVMVGADASGLELRMLAHFLGRYDGGRYRDALLDGDIHSKTQEWAGLETRDQAKTFTYATLYGAGDTKIGSIVGGGAKAGLKLKNRFYKAVPAFKRLMEDLTAAWIRNGHIRGLDGRVLRPRKKNSLLNTLLQSAGAVVMKRAVVELDAHLGGPTYRRARQVLMVHDEVQYEAPEKYKDDVGLAAVNAIVEAGQRFELRCPLAAEYKTGKNWSETH
jgi:DNA polymerase I-like protein with 3'-5' exonuclease and polymerase domains